MLRALVALPSLLAVTLFLYFSISYVWFFASQSALAAATLLVLWVISLVQLAITFMPVFSWIRRLFAASKGETPSAVAEQREVQVTRRAPAVMVDALWAVGPAAWLALPSAVYLSAFTASSLPLVTQLGNPSTRTGLLLFGTLALTYLVIWVSWARYVFRRSRGMAMPSSPGTVLFEGHVPGRQIPIGFITAVLLASTLISIMQFFWYVTTQLLL